MSGMFANIGKARASEGGVYVEPGVYAFEVSAIKKGKTRANKDFFVAEFTILESNNSDRPVGSACSWMVVFDPQYLDTALGNVKKFVSVLTDCAPDDVNEDAVEALCSEDNPAEGLKIRCTATPKPTKKTVAGADGKLTPSMFTKCLWRAH